jgi:8-oxo-dGTP pyrophosphatase MutT (NUDIX family)
MAFEPQKLYIGLVEFFSVWLPGAVLTYLVKLHWPCVFGSEVQNLESPVAWVVLLFSSYLLGHFLFLIGSLLDDYVYDPIRHCTDEHQIERLLNGRKLSPRIFRWCARLCFKKHPDAAVSRVAAIKDGYLKPIDAKGTVNAFQWCKARLSIRHPHALATVNRLEADSKFFRSFLALLAGFGVVALFHYEWWWSLGSMVLLLLAFWRYMEQRFKATQQAYWTILTMEAGKKRGPAEIHSSDPCEAQDVSSTPTHAGGVVFRGKSAARKYLLVRAKRRPNRWVLPNGRVERVLPKGQIEAGEDAPHCAIREVREETGVLARILKAFPDITYEVEGKNSTVRFFLMEAVAKGKPDERWRDPKCLAIADALDACQQARHEESCFVLGMAEEALKKDEP